MTEYSAFLKHLGIDKKQMLASMWSKIPESEKPSKRGRDMTKEEVEKEAAKMVYNFTGLWSVEVEKDKKCYCAKCKAELVYAYLEERHYLVRCPRCKTRTLVEARSPLEALNIVGVKRKIKTEKHKVEACKICDNNCGYCKFACNCSELVEVE